jgi:hypothetical protein
MPAIRINIDAQVALRAPDAKLTAQRRILIRRLLILEPPHVTDQQADLSARQLLPKCRHAAFATTHDRDQASGGCDAGMFSPPLRVGEIRRFERMTEGRISAPVGAMTTGAIAPEQIADLLSAAGSCYGPTSLRGRSSRNR